jgi:hypothetical protein
LDRPAPFFEYLFPAVEGLFILEDWRSPVPLHFVVWIEEVDLDSESGSTPNTSVWTCCDAGDIFRCLDLLTT